MNISLCMIVKDEEKVLARCLESVKPYVDEIVIADTGSSDRTAEIATRYTDHVYYFKWTDDFSAARNFSFSKATGDYILWLDADDVFPEKNAALFPAFKEQLLSLPDVVMCPYENGATSYFRERFLKRETCPLWQGRVHECIAPTGKIIRAQISVVHLGSGKRKGTRNLDIYRKWAKEEPLSGRDKFYFGRELYYNGLYEEAAALLKEMLAGDGWYVNKIEASKVLAECYFLTGKKEAGLKTLFESFLYGEPRAGVLNAIANELSEEGRFAEAVYWYRQALSARDHAKEGDFEDAFDRTLTPLLGLVRAYYFSGNYERAVICHKKAEELFPAHPAVRFNHTFFQRKNLL